jgi:hypothetical protein
MVEKINKGGLSLKSHQPVSYDIEDAEGKILIKVEQDACFASALRHIKTLLEADKKPAFLRHHLRMLCPDSAKFITFCHYSGGFFGAALSPADMIEKKQNLVDLSKVTNTELYISLCNSRYVDEYPVFAHYVVGLVEAGVDFWHAFIYSHGKCYVGTGHSWLGYTGGNQNGYGGYCSGNFTADSYKDINLVRYIKDVILGKTKLSGLAMLEHAKAASTYFNVIPLVYTKSKPRIAKDFFSDEVIALLHSNCDYVEEHIGAVS